MSGASLFGRRIIRITSGIVDIIILLIILFLAAVGGFAIWDSGHVFTEAQSEFYEVYKPKIQGETKSFEELQAINPDVFGWLTVYGTNIDYPMVQGPNNMKYINTSAFGKYSFSGAIFLDMRCKRDFSDFPSIIHGHHMEKNVMFGDLGLFKNKKYFDARRYGNLYYGGQDHGLEFFAFIHADAYDREIYRSKILTDGEKQEYLNLLTGMATNLRELDISTDDKIVLLSTCSSATTNGRDILLGRITDELHKDTFESENSGKSKSTIDGLKGLWDSAPLWMRIIIMAIIFILILLLIILIDKKRKSRKHKAGEGNL